MDAGDGIMDTTGLSFFHGTSAEFARGIANGETNEQLLADLGAFELGKEIARDIRATAGIGKNDWLPSARFPDADEEDLGLVGAALLSERQFEYGGFFASLNYEVAKRYAHHGSEYLRAIKAGLRILKRAAEELSTDRFPVLKNVLLSRHEPAVVEVSGISIDRLRATQECPSIEHTIISYEKSKNDPSVWMPAAVKIIGVRQTDIRTIVAPP
jgi:hypothetical protein